MIFLKFKKKILLLIGFFFFILSACQTVEVLRVGGFNDSLSEIQKTILKVLPQGKRAIDVTGRKFTSWYFLVEGDEFLKFDPSISEERYFAEVKILGFNRPYSLEVNVFEERILEGGNRNVSSSDYQIVSLHMEFAEMLLEQIKEELTKRRKKKKSFIDHFRVF